MAGYSVTFKPGVITDIGALPSKHRDQILKKAVTLETDPHADGNTKKQLRNGLYRLRSGDYRIIYTFEQSAVGIVQVLPRNEQTYKNLADPTMPAVANVNVNPAATNTKPAGAPLPRPVDKDVLKAARVEEAQWPALMAVKTVDELLNCEGASTEAISAVVEILWPPPIDQRLAQPNIVLAAGTTSLAAVVEQDLDVRALLLELDEKQERFVSFALDGAGPVLVRGGPGTGNTQIPKRSPTHPNPTYPKNKFQSAETFNPEVHSK